MQSEDKGPSMTFWNKAKERRAVQMAFVPTPFLLSFKIRALVSSCKSCPFVLPPPPTTTVPNVLEGLV